MVVIFGGSFQDSAKQRQCTYTGTSAQWQEEIPFDPVVMGSR